jgi:uncharacterized protein YjiK
MFDAHDAPYRTFTKAAMRLPPPDMPGTMPEVLASSGMPKRRKFRFLKSCAMLLLCVIFVLIAWSTAGNDFKPWANPFIRSALAIQQMNAADSIRQNAVWLPDFQVEIDAKPIAGIKDDLSGLTFDPDRQSLFAITNKRSEIIELSLAGDVLRRIPLRGAADPEAIEYVSPGRYVITDERRQAVIEVLIDDKTDVLDVQHNRRVAIGIGRNGNLGFEGLAYDRAGDRLFVAKERDPIQIYEITGFPFTGGTLSSLQIHDIPAYTKALPLRDLSSVHFDARTGHLLALSDDSHLIVELDKAGKAISKMSLRAGKHGLKQKIPQAEGLTMDDAGKLYVVSEPNLFYRFSRLAAAPAD